MYFHVYLIYRFTRTFTDHSSVITRCWGFELQNGKSSLKSPQTLATQDFAPASFLSTHDMKEHLLRQVLFSLSQRAENCRPRRGAPYSIAAEPPAVLPQSGPDFSLRPEGAFFLPQEGCFPAPHSLFGGGAATALLGRAANAASDAGSLCFRRPESIQSKGAPAAPYAAGNGTMFPRQPLLFRREIWAG